jgi:hypothetical protein
VNKLFLNVLSQCLQRGCYFGRLSGKSRRRPLVGVAISTLTSGRSGQLLGELAVRQAVC